MNIVDILCSSLNNENSFVREVSLFGTKDKIISSTTNNSGGYVEFDFFTIWDYVRSQDERVDEFYMIHSHPSGHNQMSATDWNMVHGWCIALGEPIWFVIVTDAETVFYRCWMDKDTKKVNREHIATYNYFTDFGIKEYSLISHLVYGISKEPIIKKDDLVRMIKEINESGVRFCNPEKYLE